ncbi:m-AAA protease-interacting protein 1, mitochondrial [Lepeophtheirus salmonis]|nr:uncharacterized protein LOC121129284 [Lepeophtheirus salmonis]
MILKSLMISRLVIQKTFIRSLAKSTLEGFDSCPFPRIFAPNPLHWLRNVFQARFLIQPFFDPRYSNSEFIKGAEMAISTVSGFLADNDFKSLESGLVTLDTLQGLKKDLPRLSEPQKSMLRVSEVGYSFVYRIGIIMPGTEGTERHVETTIVSFYHPSLGVLPSGASFSDFRDTIDSEGGLLVANYRFTRNFSKGLDLEKSNWIINGVNHFHLSSLMQPSY